MQKTIAANFYAKELIVDRTALRVMGIVFFLMLTTLGAFVYIPLGNTPVPVTMQTFFVLLGAAFLSKKDSVVALGLYTAFGAAGVPLFTLAQGGILKLLGPTGGYIIGFIAAAFLVSRMLGYFSRNSGVNFGRVLVAMISGVAVIYICGGLWLACLLKLNFSQVAALGIIPFLPAEALKVFSAACIYRFYGQRAREIFQ